ncbi:DUF3630 family protein [Colwelliaceae bacterium 6471]
MMSYKKLPPIISIDFIDNAIITCTFELDWHQDDIASLKNSLINVIGEVTEVEHIIGADRENIRFVWQGHYFILNFECVSQSCWIEGDDLAGIENIDQLYSSIT